jgi:hypothetical protein
LISDPDENMVQLIVDFLSVRDAASHDVWLARAKAYLGGQAKAAIRGDLKTGHRRSLRH